MLGGLRILVADKDAGRRNRIRLECERKGWIVEEADTLEDLAWRWAGFGADVVVASSQLETIAVHRLATAAGPKGLIYGEPGESTSSVLVIPSSDPLTIVRALQVLERDLTMVSPEPEVIVLFESRAPVGRGQDPN